jgi:hypothetical protein
MTRIGLCAAMTAVALASSGALTACGSTDADRTSASQTDTASAEPSPTPSQSPTPTATATSSSSATPSPAASATEATTGAATPAPAPASSWGALLSAQELPRLGGSSWTQRSTGDAGSQPFGLCQKFDLLSIGAERVRQRTFTAEGGATAGQQVAQFPDAQNTVRAGKVLEAWHRDCVGRVGGERVRVRPLQDVPVSTGRGWRYLVSFERGGNGHLHSFGVVVSGDRLVLLRMDEEGQDHDYPAGRDPMELAVKAAAAKLG